MENERLRSAPWLASLGEWAHAARPACGVAQALQLFWPEGGGAPLSAGGHALRPVAAGMPLGALAYERHIAATGELPTRDNAHDWYNALVWLAFPQTRQTINRLQVDESRGDAVGVNGRTRRRDALTLLDENGAVLVTCESVFSQALSEHDWETLFVHGRSRWAACAEVWVMGHALLEKLEAPRMDLCAHVRVWLMDARQWASWRALDDDGRRCGVDAWLADDISAHLQTPRDLQPLPLMGIPGWHTDNANSDFYNNRSVFRGKRRADASCRVVGAAILGSGSGPDSRCSPTAEESPDSSGQGAG